MVEYSEARLRLEALVSVLPTRKCKRLTNVLGELAENYSEVRLDIYYAGTTPRPDPTEGFKDNADKRLKVPAGFVNGVPINEVVDNLEVEENVTKLRDFLVAEISKGPSHWQR